MKKKKMKHPAEIGEAITMAISITVFTGLILYLLYNLKHDPSDYIPVTAQTGATVAVPGSAGYITPITVTNHGSKSMAYLQLDVMLDHDDEHTVNIEVDYLSRQSSRDVYLITDRPVAAENIDIRPVYYKFD